MSNIRSLSVSGQKIVIGDVSVDRKAEDDAERLIAQAYPDLTVVSSADGRRHIRLQDILSLERRFQQEKITVETDAFKRGQKNGFEAGLEKGREEARKVVASLSGMLTDLTRQRQELLTSAKSEVLELILKISRRLTFAAVELDPEVTRSIIHGAIDNLLDKNKIKVKVNPGHLPQLEQYIDDFRGSNTAIKEFAIEADPRVRVGGCFIETPVGDIDARLESMYDVIKQSILENEEKPA